MRQWQLEGFLGDLSYPDQFITAYAIWVEILYAMDDKPCLKEDSEQFAWWLCCKEHQRISMAYALLKDWGKWHSWQLGLEAHQSLSLSGLRAFVQKTGVEVPQILKEKAGL